MKFLFGSQNFGLDMPDSDKDYMQFYYPAADALCRLIPSPREVKEEDGSVTKHVDIRALPGLFYKSNLDILQLLYSKEVQDGGELETYFREHEEELSTINIPRLYKSVVGAALNRYAKGTSKDIAHIIFGFKTLLQFESQGFQNLRKCFEHNDHEVYKTIRKQDDYNWYLYARELEKLVATKKEPYLAQAPNDAFKEQMEHDFGLMIVRHLT